MTAPDPKTVLRAAYMDAHKGQEPAQELRAEVDALIAAVEAGGLDRAWAEAEAALAKWAEGSRFESIEVSWFLAFRDDGAPRRYVATAEAIEHREPNGPPATVHDHEVDGDTPALALLALAERLRAEP